MISTASPTQLQEGIKNFTGPLAQTVLSLIERELDPDGSTSNAAELQPFKSAVANKDEDGIASFLMLSGKDTVDKLNGYFIQVAKVNAELEADEKKPDST